MSEIPASTPINQTTVFLGVPEKTGKPLYVMTQDFGTMTWREATVEINKMNKEQGTHWHMPTKDELDYMFKKKTDIEGLGKKRYWSSQESRQPNALSRFTTFAQAKSFANGNDIIVHKGERYGIRLVSNDPV